MTLEESYIQWSVCDSGRKLRTVVCLWLWKKVTYSGLFVIMTLEESYVQLSVCDSGTCCKKVIYSGLCVTLEESYVQWSVCDSGTCCKKVIYSGLCVTLEESYIQWSVCDSGRKLYAVVCVWLWNMLKCDRAALLVSWCRVRSAALSWLLSGPPSAKAATTTCSNTSTWQHSATGWLVVKHTKICAKPAAVIPLVEVNVVFGDKWPLFAGSIHWSFQRETNNWREGWLK